MKEIINKKDIDIVVEFIENCWDENNPNDNLTFDQRIESRKKELTNNQQIILSKCM